MKLTPQLQYCNTCKNPIDKRNQSGFCKHCRGTQFKDGRSHTRIYKLWHDMNYRCNRSDFKNYGNRGIKVEWESFEDFYKDMNPYYEQLASEIGEINVSIERLDVNGNYSKDNCTRIHKNLQGNNKRNNKHYTYNDITDTLAGWSKRLGINRLTLYSRIYDSGWSIERAFSTPKQGVFGK